jgi:hypothetical protein
MFVAVLRRMSRSVTLTVMYNFPCCAFITDLYTGAPALIVHTQEKKELPSFSLFCFLKIILFL